MTLNFEVEIKKEKKRKKKKKDLGVRMQKVHMYTHVYKCCPWQSLVDYGNTKMTPHALN